MDDEFWRTEALEAGQANLSGDPWPLAILEFRMGNKRRLLDLVLRFGVPAGSEAAKFIAEALETGKINRAGKATIKHAQIVRLYSIYRDWLENCSQEPEKWAKEKSMFSVDGKIISNVEDVEAAVAYRSGETIENVRQIIKRHRREQAKHPAGH